MLRKTQGFSMAKDAQQEIVICKVYKRGWLPQSQWLFVDTILTSQPETISVADCIDAFHEALGQGRWTWGVINGYDWELFFTYPLRWE